MDDYLVGDEVDEILAALDDEDVSGYGEEIVEVGEDDLVGYDEDDDLGYFDDEPDYDVGARRRRRRRRRPRRRATMRRVKARAFRRYPLGLGTTSIAAGATAIISALPQLPFKLERLSTPAQGLVIDNIQVGTVSQFVAAGAVASEVFGTTATGVALRGDTAVPGVAIQITVSNPTAAAVVFSGALIGLVAQ